MLKKILIGLAGAIVLLLALIATRPSTFHVDRSITVAAPVDIVFSQVGDQKKFEGWSPWNHLDPNMTRRIEGPEQGVGSSYYWSGNDEVGEGRMTITEWRENEFVSQKLEFIKPFPSVAQTSHTLKVDGENVTVTWAMDGTNDFIGKAFSLMMDMNAMIGTDMEKGLANLKRVAEAEAEARKAAEAAAKLQAEQAAAEAAAQAASGTETATTDSGAAPATP